jgi:hypothetical protein
VLEEGGYAAATTADTAVVGSCPRTVVEVGVAVPWVVCRSCDTLEEHR